MKAYLCVEGNAPVVDFDLSKTQLLKMPEGDKKAAWDAGWAANTRPSIYFVLKDETEEGAKEKLTEMRAIMVRELTEKELASEGEDGSYDIEL
jgi:hypothetical protein